MSVETFPRNLSACLQTSPLQWSRAFGLNLNAFDMKLA